MTYKYSKSYCLPNGKRKNIRSNNKKDFERRCYEFERDRGDGLRVEDGTTVVRLMQVWFDTLKRPYLRKSSLEHEKYIINSHCLPEWFAAKKVKDVRMSDIDQIMYDVRNLSASTQGKVLGVLRSAFQYAVDNDLIRKSPIPGHYKLRVEKSVEREPVLTYDQTRQLMEVTKGTRVYIPICLMLGLGLRRGEVCGLKWGDLDLDDAVAHVRNTVDLTPGKEEFVERTKTDAGRRDIPIPDWLLLELREEKGKTNSMFVCPQKNGDFHTNSSWKNLWKNVIRREKASATEHDKHTTCPRVLEFHCHPHQLRHTCITRWVEAGFSFKEVQYMAGHASIDMTLSVYAQYDKESRFEGTKEKMKSLDPRIASSL